MPKGNMTKKHAHTPIAQYRLRSLDERRFIILTMSGIFQRGRIMLAIKAILFIRLCLRSPQHARFYAYTSSQARLLQGQDIYEDQTLSGSARILRES